MASAYRITFAAILIFVAGCDAEQPSVPAVPAVEPAAVLTESDGSNLQVTRRGRAYVHLPTRIEFLLPAGWTVSSPVLRDRVSALPLQKGGEAIRVTLSWSPVESDLVQVVAAELERLRERHGDENVGLLERVQSGDRTGWKVELAAEAGGDESHRGSVYWFEARGTDTRRWKIKLRATLDEAADPAEVDELLGQFEWTKRDYGPREE